MKMTKTRMLKYFLCLGAGIFGGLVSIMPAKNLLISLSAVISPFLLYALFKSDKLLIAVMIYFFTIDTSGALLPIPIKPLLFFMLVIKSWQQLKGETKASIKFVFFTISVALPVYAITVSVFRGNNLSYAISDANSYVFFIIGYFLILKTMKDPSIKYVVIKHLLISGFILASVTVSIYLLVTSGVFPLEIVNSFLRDRGMGMALIEIDGNYRIFLAGQIYMVVSTLYLLNQVLDVKQKIKFKHAILLCLFLVAILISNTRGLWLASAIGFTLLFILNRFSFRKIFIVGFLLFSFSISSFLLEDDFLSNAKERIMSMTDFSQNNLSNYIRYQQSIELKHEFLNYPIFGKGFGATLSSGYYRNENMPYTFELSYFELMYKLGIVGFSIFILSLLMIGIILLKSKDKTHRFFAFSTYLTLLTISTTNPYIVSSLGIFLLAILLIFYVEEKSKTQSYNTSNLHDVV
jgi:hypothetical protein